MDFVYNANKHYKTAWEHKENDTSKKIYSYTKVELDFVKRSYINWLHKFFKLRYFFF